jgi:hypothetical protein
VGDQQVRTISNSDKTMKGVEGGRRDTRSAGHVSRGAGVEVPIGRAWMMSCDAGVM